MSESIFRKKTLDRISSPEQLNDYIKVANPSVWMILGAVMILLIGVCAWGVFGQIHTTIKTAGVCEDGNFVCYVSQEDMSRMVELHQVESAETRALLDEIQVKVDGEICEVQSIAATPIKLGENIIASVMHIAEFQTEEWVYPISVSGDFQDGIYEVAIIAESISPVSFVVN